MSTVNRILVSAGVHGNELSGIRLLQHIECRSETLQFEQYPALQISGELINKAAIDRNVRFCDEDLNRQFIQSDILNENSEASLEVALANQLKKAFGPLNPSSQPDLIIDIHNTTSAMGPTLIVLELDEYAIGLCRYVKTQYPDANILVEDQIPYSQQPYFCTLGKRGIMLEIGAQTHGTLSANIYQQTRTLLSKVLEYCDLVARESEMPSTPPVEAYRLDSEVYFPAQKDGSQVFIHPSLQGADFSKLKDGAPAFQTINGETIDFSGSDTYPHFIGEAAYTKSNIAFATAALIQV